MFRIFLCNGRTEAGKESEEREREREKRERRREARVGNHMSSGNFRGTGIAILSGVER